jgi:hypothetical protein
MTHGFIKKYASEVSQVHTESSHLESALAHIAKKMLEDGIEASEIGCFLEKLSSATCLSCKLEIVGISDVDVKCIIQAMKLSKALE